MPVRRDTNIQWSYGTKVSTLILKLKSWLSLAEAAQHLSHVFTEPVSESDVRHFAEIGKLPICVRFRSPIWGRPIRSSINEDSSSLQKDDYIELERIGELKIPLGAPAKYDGIFSFTKMAGEQEILRNLDWEVTGETTRPHTTGLLLQTDELAVICPGEIIASTDSNGTPHFIRWTTLPASAKFCVTVDCLQTFTKTIQSGGYSPEDSNRPSDLSNTSEAPDSDKAISKNSESSYLNIIGVLVELILSHKPTRTSQARLIDEMIDNYSEKYGISKSNLEGKFALANKHLRSDNPN
jgi:hypothetical protein